jgi:hypothetical protein
VKVLHICPLKKNEVENFSGQTFYLVNVHLPLARTHAHRPRLPLPRLASPKNAFPAFAHPRRLHLRLPCRRTPLPPPPAPSPPPTPAPSPLPHTPAPLPCSPATSSPPPHCKTQSAGDLAHIGEGAAVASSPAPGIRCRHRIRHPGPRPPPPSRVTRRHQIDAALPRLSKLMPRHRRTRDQVMQVVRNLALLIHKLGGK